MLRNSDSPSSLLDSGPSDPSPSITAVLTNQRFFDLTVITLCFAAGIICSQLLFGLNSRGVFSDLLAPKISVPSSENEGLDNTRIWSDSRLIHDKKRTLNVVFRFNPLPADQGGAIFETDWIEQVLLGEMKRPIKYHHNSMETFSDALYIYLFGLPDNFLQNARDQGHRNLGILHMGDEMFSTPVTHYPNADYAFHDYYREEYLTSKYTLFEPRGPSSFPAKMPSTTTTESNPISPTATEFLQKTWKTPVLWLPGGIKAGLGTPIRNAFLPADRRQFVCNFVGSMRSNRGEAVNAVRTAGPPFDSRCFISNDRGWADPNNIKVIEYRNILLNSAFTLCPWGNNPESMRYWEALEAGSLPIFQRVGQIDRDFVAHLIWPPPEENETDLEYIEKYNSSLVRPAPVQKLVVDNWAQAPDLMRNLLNNPVEMVKLQEEVVEWWRRYRSHLQRVIRDTIEESFARYYPDEGKQ